jgi:dsDNA-specific endonuclease/ATPase MutS2
MPNQAPWGTLIIVGITAIASLANFIMNLRIALTVERFKREMLETENRIIFRLNGTYIRAELAKSELGNIHGNLDRIQSQIDQIFANCTNKDACFVRDRRKVASLGPLGVEMVTSAGDES